jgi:two-component system nitrogen regulation sensor histidine kinase NtrY
VRLQTKLTLAFVAVALAPIAVLAGIARVVISNQYRGEFRRTLEQAEAEVEREYQRIADDVREATARVARVDDPTLGPLLVELARGPLDDEHQRDLETRAETQMRALGFDVFEILDERGEVLAAAHYPGRAGDVDAAALSLGRGRSAQAQLVEEQVLDGGSARKQLALEAAREVQAGFALEGRRPRVIVVGGRVLGHAFLDRLHRGARLVGPDGKVLLGPASGGGHYPQTVVEFKRADGTIAARVEITIPNDDLERTLALISFAAAGLGLGGLALALLLGAFVARRWSRPLGELADGARAVARGQLDTHVEVVARDEVGELATAFNAMIRDLRTAREELVRAERVAAWREIAQRIAHEIKNPLTPIQMAIETLQRAYRRAQATQATPTTPTARAAGDNPSDGSGGPPSRAVVGEQFDALFGESAQAILDEVGRLKHIVAEFSSFARMPAPKLAPCDVGELVEAALALYSGAVPLERALATGLPPALADRDQVTQVIMNLLENARDAIAAGSDGGRITVATRVSNGRVEIEVADSGPGLSDEARAKLFTPYFTTKAKGTGLGLAIVHRIVSDHGGEIRVGGAVGQGAVFTVALPRA